MKIVNMFGCVTLYEIVVAIFNEILYIIVSCLFVKESNETHKKID